MTFRGLASFLRGAAPWLALTAVPVVCVLLDEKLCDRELEALGFELRYEAERSGHQVEDHLRSHSQVVRTVRRQFELGRIRNQEDFVAESESFQSVFAGFQALNWVDAAGTIQWVVPREPNREAIGLNLLGDHPARPAVEKAIKSGELIVCAPVDLAQGGRGITCYLAVESGGQVTGILNAVFRIDRVMRDSLRKPSFGVALEVSGDAPIAEFGDPPFDRDEHLFGIAEIEVGDQTWRVVARPTAAAMAAVHPTGRRIFMGLGVALVFILACMTRVAHAQRKRIFDSERRYRRIIDTAQEGVLVLDPDGCVGFANRRLADLLGYGEVVMRGKALRNLIDPLDGDRVIESLLDCRAGNNEILDVVMICRDGKRLDTVFSTAALTDGSTFLGILAMVSDVTDRRQLEAELRQSQKMEAVGRLAGGVAHDFNNLLVVVRGAADLLAVDVEGNPDGMKLLAEIVAASERGSGLTKRLLAFSRKEVVRPQDIDLREAVGNLEPMLRRVIGEDIVMEFSLAEEAVPVRIDTTQLEQVILNLVINAREAMPTGGRVHVRCWLSGGVAQMDVSDDGPGVPISDRERVFEPFFTTRRQMGGTGLGLSTVHGVVEQAGGSIAVVDAELGGACFRVRLPIVQHVSGTDSVVLSFPTEARGERVLLVEDETSVRDVLEQALRRAGYLVDTAESAAAARVLLRQSGAAFNVMVTDVIMPGESGVELARYVQREWPECRVLLMSGYIDLQLGIDELPAPLIRKPFSARTLITEIQRIMTTEEDRVTPT